MRDTILIILTAAFLLTVLVGCSRQFAPSEPDIEPDKTGDETTMAQTGWTTAVPSAYFEPSDHPGTVSRLDYESEDYVRDGAPITKTAYVYTPYGYDAEDAETRYNIGCVRTAMVAYIRMGEARYREAMELLDTAWGGAPDSYRSANITAFTRFVELYHGEYDRQRLLARLARVDPLTIYREGLALGLKLSGYKRYLYQVYRIYNNGKGEKWLLMQSAHIRNTTLIGYRSKVKNYIIPKRSGEVVTDIYFDFGKVPVGFQSVSGPKLAVTVLGTLANGYQIVNRADVGGRYQNTWETATASWITIVRKLTPDTTLPKTGY